MSIQSTVARLMTANTTKVTTPRLNGRAFRTSVEAMMSLSAWASSCPVGVSLWNLRGASR